MAFGSRASNLAVISASQRPSLASNQLPSVCVTLLAGESVETSALRELLEETGYTGELRNPAVQTFRIA